MFLETHMTNIGFISDTGERASVHAGEAASPLRQLSADAAFPVSSIRKGCHLCTSCGFSKCA